MSSTDSPALSILLPVRNEGINLKIMLKILEAVVEVPHEVLVIYDFPEDTTVPVVQSMQKSYPHLKAVHNTLGKGVVNAIKSGVKIAVGEYVLIFAADEVGPVLVVNDMLALMDEGCEFISCTRYAHGGRRLGGSFIGGILSRVANRVFGFLTGSAFTDSTTGIKMFKRSVFDKLNLQANPVGWAVAFEMAIKAQQVGLVLGEVPIVSIDRLYGGKSTFKLGSWSIEYLKWFFKGLKSIGKRSKGSRSQVKVKIPTAYSFFKGASK